MTGWDYFTAFYFLFNSVALIGFGDVFPKKPRVILVNMFFIVLGVVLFSMCYFILQEEIRVKAFEASRKVGTWEACSFEFDLIFPFEGANQHCQIQPILDAAHATMESTKLPSIRQNL